MSMRLKWIGLVTLLVIMCNISVNAGQPEKSGMGFTYQEKIENPGSKSAGVRGVLLFNGLPVTRGIGDIRTPIGTFTYVHSNLLFRPQGWFPVDDFIVPNTTEPVTSEMLRKGSYSGALRTGTPDDWCYLVQSGIWSAPNLLVAKNNSHPFQGAGVKPTGGERLKDMPPECKLKPERGPCKALFEMYYYDAPSNQCKSFFWGGCQGVVPFRSEEDCARKCMVRR